ncbi:MAG: hypothetical protein V4739_01990 [Pseudomonadota bacterium]
MQLSFRHLALASAALCFFLAATWLVAPQLLLWMWGVPYTDSAGLVGRRGAALFFGIACMLVVARSSGPSQGRLALAGGIAAGCLALAMLGLLELLRGRAGLGILPAVVVEIVLAWGFSWSALGDRAVLRDESNR